MYLLSVYKERTKNWLCQFVVNMLPARVIYFAAVKVWTHGTTGQYGDTVVGSVAAEECIKRWGNDHDKR